jgi:uncharacterized protein
MVETVLERKKEKLLEILRQYDGLVVAFSGGVDSTLLLAVAHSVLGDRLVAVTAQSPVHPARETAYAVRFARMKNIRHRLVRSQEMQQTDFLANPVDRCYICKKNILADLRAIGRQLGINHVAHGANLDDLGDYRPGMQAAEEAGVDAPLLEAGLTKADIRRLSKQMNLETWNRPSMACLATRIPYGTPITEKALQMVDQAEEFLLNLGFSTCRVRHHGELCRIELLPEELVKALGADVRRTVASELRRIGFRYVTVDLQGYVQGSMNP